MSTFHYLLRRLDRPAQHLPSVSRPPLSPSLCCDFVPAPSVSQALPSAGQASSYSRRPSALHPYVLVLRRAVSPILLSAAPGLLCPRRSVSAYRTREIHWSAKRATSLSWVSVSLSLLKPVIMKVSSCSFYALSAAKLMSRINLSGWGGLSM